MLSRLIYTSTSLCTAEDAQQICVDARDSNARDDVTGALYLADNTFWQYLEGDELVVSALYGRIQRDRRHRHCHLLDSRLISARIFKGWAMAWLPHTIDTRHLTESLLPDCPGTGPMDGGSAGALFIALARAAERQ